MLAKEKGMDSHIMKRIAALASRYPGVKIRSFHESSSGCSIDMHICNPISMVHLVVSASVTNLNSAVFAWSHPADNDFSDPLLLIYRFSTHGEPCPGERLSAMEVFGIDMAHDLHDMGILSQTEAEAIIAEINDRLSERPPPSSTTMPTG